MCINSLLTVMFTDQRVHCFMSLLRAVKSHRCRFNKVWPRPWSTARSEKKIKSDATLVYGAAVWHRSCLSSFDEVPVEQHHVATRSQDQTN